MQTNGRQSQWGRTVPILAALMLALSLALAAGPAVVQAAGSTVTDQVAYYYVSGDAGFLRSTTPINESTGGGSASQTDNGNGTITVDLSSVSNYADSGFSIDAGTLNDLNGALVQNTGDDIGFNLWFDVDGNGEFFAWSGGTPDTMTDLDGDKYILGPASSAGVLEITGSTQFTSLQPGGGDYTLDQLKAGAASGIDGNTHVAIWTGVCCGGTKNATILSVHISSGPITTVYVDDDYSAGDADGHIFGVDAFATIQEGVDAVADGGTVNVAAGTYTEDITVDKSLTLSGAQAGNAVSGRTHGGSTESILEGVITVDANNVEVDGFSLTNPSGTRVILIQQNSSDVTITNNIVQDVGSTTSNENVHTIYLAGGPDNVSIIGNVLSQLRSNDKTVSGVFVGDSTGTDVSENVLIQGNTISDVVSDGPNRKWGTYGILVNHVSSDAHILNNTISGLNGEWAHAIGLEGDTSNAVIRGNNISDLTDNKTPPDAVAIFFEDNPSGGSVEAHFNNFDNLDVGVAQHPTSPGGTYDVNATHNWWSDASGPSSFDSNNPEQDPSTGTAASGSGAIVGTNVRFDPWLGAATTNVSSDTLNDGDSVGLGNTSAIYGGTGSATVTLAQYANNPSGSSVSGGLLAGKSYYDVNVADNTDPAATLEVTVPADAAGEVLRYYDGSAWRTVISNDGSVPTADSTPQITAVFGPNSTPKLSELTGTPIVSSQPAAIAVQFSENQVVQGQQVAAKVVVSSTDLAGVEVHLTFDASALQVDQVILGNDLAVDTVGQNEYDNTAGTIDFAYSQIAGRSPVSGNDQEVATILFTAQSPTSAPTVVDYSSTVPTIFSDPDGFDIGRYVQGDSNNTLDAQAGSVTTVQGATIQGTVLLQGRSDHQGAIISVQPGQTLQDTTDASGGFSLSGLIPGGPDGVAGGSSYDVSASMPGYLTAQKTGFEPTAGTNPAFATITLLGGDANHDQTINIQDLALIGFNFGCTVGSSCSNDNADINGDGTVNILDLTLAGTNFGQSGPTSW